MDNSPNIELENFMHNVAWLRRHNGLSKKEMAHLFASRFPELELGQNAE